MLTRQRGGPRRERQRFWTLLLLIVLGSVLGLWATSPDNAPMATYVGLSVLVSVALAPSNTAPPAWWEWAGYGALIGPLIAWRRGLALAIALVFGLVAQVLIYGLGRRRAPSDSRDI